MEIVDTRNSYGGDQAPGHNLGPRGFTQLPAIMAAHSKFRPCIDLHDGLVKQIVGGTLSDVEPSALKTNFVSS